MHDAILRKKCDDIIAAEVVWRVAYSVGSALAAPLSTSLRTWDLGISRTYGRFLGIAGRVFCLFSYGCHICCVSILLETLVFPINLYVHNNVKDVESGAALADAFSGRRECDDASAKADPTEWDFRRIDLLSEHHARERPPRLGGFGSHRWRHWRLLDHPDKPPASPA